MMKDEDERDPMKEQANAVMRNLDSLSQFGRSGGAEDLRLEAIERLVFIIGFANGCVSRLGGRPPCFSWPWPIQMEDEDDG